MYYAIGVSVPSLHRESTDSNIFGYSPLYIKLVSMQAQARHKRTCMFVQMLYCATILCDSLRDRKVRFFMFWSLF